MQRPTGLDFKSILRPKDAEELLETKPRRIVTSAFHVTNPTDEKREFVCEVKLPDGWVLITKDFEFELNPEERVTKLVSFFVPQATLAGKYEMTYVIKDRRNPSIRDYFTMYVVVLPVSKLQMKLLESPSFVIAGEEYRSSFAIINQGNKEYTIKIKVNSSDEVAYTVDAEEIVLSPGQSKTIVVTSKTDAKTTKKLEHRLGLTAEVVEDGSTKAKAQSASLVEVLPRVSGVEDNFHRVPTEVTFRYVSEENGERSSGFQTEVRGEGTLDEEGEKHIEFGFRGPDVQDKSIFGERDEYFVSYRTKDYKLDFGDRSYSLSSLTEKYLYGRGLEGRFNIGDDFSVGAYHMKTRWLEPRIHETAAYMDYSIDDRSRIGLNYLRKIKGGECSNILSFEGQFEPFEDTELELEYALGPGGGRGDNAYLSRLYGRSDWLNYYLKLIHAGPDYPGYYSDLDYLSGGVTVPIAKGLRVNASFRREKNNLDLDPSFYCAALERYYQLGLDYRLESDTTFSFDWLGRDRQDRLASPEFDYREETFRFGVGKGFDKLTVHTSAEFGQTDNKLQEKTFDSQRYTASVYYKPGDKQSYSGYFYYDNDSDFTGENKRSTTFGLNAQYRIAERTFLNFALQTNDYQSSAHGDRDNLELRLSHTFANDTKVSIVGRHTRYRNSDADDETALMVQYAIPLGLPVGRKKSVGSIIGYVYDQQSADGISDCLLRLGGWAAVTDKEGKFAFFSLKPGLYYLNVDTASMGMNRVPNRKTPIELAVLGGEKTEVDIPITEAARLWGRIAVYSKEDGSSSSKSYYVVGTGGEAEEVKLAGDCGLANTLVELKNNSEVKRAITDRRGYFAFEQVRPGKWTLKIYADNLPVYHYLEKDTFEVELKPGESKEISGKVLPRKRRIKIISAPQTVMVEEKK